MATVPAKRHALGLPEASVRTLLALLVVALTCALLLVPSNKSIPLYLVLLVMLVVGHLFGTGSSRYPLHVPMNLIRLVIISALVATIVYRYVNDRQGLNDLLNKSLDEAKEHLYMPALLLGGLFLGLILRMLVGRENPSYFVQDLEAWLALIAVIGLVIAGFIHLVINPSLDPNENAPISLSGLGGFLAVVIAFYFGARS
jgi:glucan phosphoethanolaminetransferase (alkaline phosphatase superfamily)